MKKTLIVVDMQNDFIDGSLGTKEAEAIVENVRQKIGQYREAGDEIIFTRDTHQKNYLETNEGRHLPVEHCIEGTEGWKIAEGLEVPGAIYVNKSGFGYTDWKDYQLEDVEIVGLCTDICVVSNALILYKDLPANSSAPSGQKWNLRAVCTGAGQNFDSDGVASSGKVLQAQCGSIL